MIKESGTCKEEIRTGAMAEKQKEVVCVWEPANDSRFKRRKLEI